MAGLAYTVDDHGRESASPSQRLPFVRLRSVCATQRQFVASLARSHVDIDRHLSALQRAESAALDALLNDRLHAAMQHFFWAVDANFEAVTRTVYAAALPFPLGYVVRSRRRQHVLAELAVLDLADAAAATSAAVSICNALALRLGAGAYFFGAQPSSLDATAYGLLAVALHAPLPDTTLRDAVQAHPNLVAFVQRVSRDFFGGEIRIAEPVIAQPSDGRFISWKVPVEVPQFRSLTRADYRRNRIDTLFIVGTVVACSLFLFTSKLGGAGSAGR